jgi:hypothetical protein
MSDVVMLIYTMIGMGFLFGIMAGYIYFNTFRWVQMKRSITKKNHGIIYFMSRGKALYPKVVNFGNDVIRTHKGLWVLYEGAIYRQVIKEEGQQSENADIAGTMEMSIGEPKGRLGLFHKTVKKVTVRIHKKITDEDFKYRQGIPIMYLDIEDMIPMRLMSEKMDLPITRNPYMIEAVLGKEVAAAELEALKMTKKSIKMLIMVTAVLVIMAIAIGALTYFNTDTIGVRLYNNTQSLDRIEALVRSFAATAGAP